MWPQAVWSGKGMSVVKASVVIVRFLVTLPHTMCRCCSCRRTRIR